jgi:hypothetical protein
MKAAREGREMDDDGPAADDLRGRDLIDRVAAEKGEPVGPTGQHTALEWFLAAEPEEDFTKTIRLNVGGPVDEDGVAINPANPPQWIDWTIRPLDLDEIKRIRRQSQDAKSRRQRRRDQDEKMDDTQFNLGVVVAATVEPDLVEASQRMRMPDGQVGIADPRLAVKWRFQQKSGLIGQIVGEVLDLSGYNENDVQDAVEAKAAGNS